MQALLGVMIELMIVDFFFFLMIRRPPRSTQSRSSAASDVYKRQKEYYIYAKGVIEMYDGRYQIVLQDKDQIWTE